MLLHTAAFNLGLGMRSRFDCGTPRGMQGLAAAGRGSRERLRMRLSALWGPIGRFLDLSAHPRPPTPPRPPLAPKHLAHAALVVHATGSLAGHFLHGLLIVRVSGIGWPYWSRTSAVRRSRPFSAWILRVWEIWHRSLGQANDMGVEPTDGSRLLQEKQAECAGLTEVEWTTVPDRIKALHDRSAASALQSRIAAATSAKRRWSAQFSDLDERFGEARRAVEWDVVSERIA